MRRTNETGILAARAHASRLKIGRSKHLPTINVFSSRLELPITDY
jgi:hypothetical protein